MNIRKSNHCFPNNSSASFGDKWRTSQRIRDYIRDYRNARSEISSLPTNRLSILNDTSREILAHRGAGLDPDHISVFPLVIPTRRPLEEQQDAAAIFIESLPDHVAGLLWGAVMAEMEGVEG